MKKAIKRLEAIIQFVGDWRTNDDDDPMETIYKRLVKLLKELKKLEGQDEQRTVLERDMAFVRALLRFIWQSYDRNGESWGRSFQCHVLELAVALLDHHFSRDADLHERMDNNARETIKDIEAVASDYAWQSRIGGSHEKGD